MKAIWNNTIIAQSDSTIEIERNQYFPAESLNMEFFHESDHQTVCPWKGTASYFDLVVDGKENQAAAWVYRDPKEAAANIKGYVAFWKGVEILSD